MTFLAKMRSKFPIGAEVTLSCNLHDGTFEPSGTFVVVSVGCLEGDEDAMVWVGYEKKDAEEVTLAMMFSPDSMELSKNIPQQRVDSIRPKKRR